MKICPQCNKNYNDDNLNFCLDDGSVLNQSGGGIPASDDLPATVMMNQTPSTSKDSFTNQSQNSGLNPQFGGQQQNQTNWENPPPQIQPVKKGSKSWLWVIGILGVLILVCGGGFIGFIAVVSNFDDNTNWNSNAGDTSNAKIANSRNPSDDKVSPTPDDRKSSKKIDLEFWAKGDSDLGATAYENGDFLMNAKKPDFYYVLVSQKDYKTENATTKVTIKNLDSASTNLGYGLVFHSDPNPLQKDYAFLIDTEKKRFRIVRHLPKNEFTVMDWTQSDAIKSGSEENVLEVRDEGSKMDFYINGAKVSTKTNVFGYRNGVAGLYAGSYAPIAFSEFEIKK